MIGPTDETDADTNAVVWDDKKLRSLKTVESVALMQKEVTAMMQKHGVIDWKVLEKKYISAVGIARKNASEVDQRKYVFANQSQLRAAYEVLSLAAVQKQIMSDDLVRECKELRKKLKDNRGHKFPPARPRIVPASMGSSSSSADAGTGSGSAQIVVAEKSSPLGDWTKYPECVRTKVCKLDKGQWTKELLGQRLDVLRRVRWCLCCGEVCQVRSDKDANWSDAEIIGDCHRKNTVKDNNGSAYPECNKTGVWESVKYTPQMKDIRRNEIRKLQREFAKRVASASGQRKKKSKKLK